jgi:putative addiction module component (TIGR02574 family)
MTMSTQAIFDAALALPEAERAALAERLLESLSPEPDEISDEEWLAELQRRSADFEIGTAEAVPWSELKKEE